MFKDENNNIDLISGDPKKAIIKLATPMVFSMFVVMLYKLTDSIWVAGLGGDALAAIGFIMPLYVILTGVGDSIAAGANSLISRKIGSKNHKQANNGALHSLLLCIIISAIFTIVMLVFMVPIFKMLGVGHSMQYALDYGYVMFGLLFFIELELLLMSLFKAEGNMKTLTLVLILSYVVNMILDPLLIYVLNWGISGAAWATVLSSALGAFILGFFMWSKRGVYLDMSIKNFNFQFPLINDILKVAVPSTFESMLYSVGIIIINNMIVSVSKSVAVGYYSTAMNIVQFANLPLSAIGVAVLTISGVAYGANNAKNLKTTYLYSIKISFVIAIVFLILLYAFAPQISSLFAYNDSSLAPNIANALAIDCFFLITYPMGTMTTMLFKGAGKGLYSFIFAVIRCFILAILFAYLFGFVFGWGFNGILAGEVFGNLVGVLLGYVWARLFIRNFDKSIEKSNVETS